MSDYSDLFGGGRDSGVVREVRPGGEVIEHTVYHTGNVHLPLAEGGLIESRSLSNGHFMRFASGTQMCWMTTRATTPATPSGGLVILSRVFFPVEFFDRPVVAVSHDSGWASDWVVRTEEVTREYVGFTFLTNSGVSAKGETIHQISYFTVGRWKR